MCKALVKIIPGSDPSQVKEKRRHIACRDVGYIVKNQGEDHRGEQRLNEIPQWPQDGLFINRDNIPFNEQDEQIPVIPNLFKIQVYYLAFGAYFVEPVVLRLFQSLDELEGEIKKISSVIALIKKYSLSHLTLKIVFRKNISLSKLNQPLEKTIHPYPGL